MSEETRLLVAERQIVYPEGGKHIGKVVTALSPLRAGNVEWILGKSEDSASGGRKRFGSVVDRPAVSVTNLPSEAVPVLHTHLGLQAVINGIASVRVLDDATKVAVGISHRVSGRVRSLCTGQRRICARCQTAGYQIAETGVYQGQNIWIAIDLLEVPQGVVPHVANFGGHLAANLTLHTEVPLL